MPLDPQAAAVLAEVPSEWTDPEAIAALTVADVRALAGEPGAEVEPFPLPEGVEVEKVVIEGGPAPLPGRVYRPSEDAEPGTVLWIRGGGFCVIGHLEQDVVSPLLARESGRAVVTFDYRLTPEHPFPAPAEDAFAALRWVAANAQRLGGSPRIAIGGDSAGGNLAAAATLMAREQGGPEAVLQLLVYPMTARRFDGASPHDPEAGVLAHPEMIEWLWREYLAGADGADPLASPLDAETLAGLPPALVITAEYDVLRDEGEAYAARLAAEGVAVESRRYEGMPHGFVEWPGEVDAAAECLRRMGAAFAAALADE
ncbi:MAG TPA: alpha/beta hydrolase [Solirubrobacterales bacterium]|nr:alpha/beta hydrolase [Solirubrobacterales bacterium]